MAAPERTYSHSEMLLNEFRVEGAVAMRIRIAPGEGLWLDSDDRKVVHLVLSGSLPITLPDGTTKEASAGDCILVFYGERHLLGDARAPQTHVVPAWSVMDVPDQLLEVGTREGPAGPDEAVLLTFVLSFAFNAGAPSVIRSLPNLWVLPADAKTGALPFRLDTDSAEAAFDGPGGTAVATLMGACLFTFLLRQISLTLVFNGSVRHVRTPNSRRIAAIMREVRAFPGRPWTVESMARSIGLSRSAFAEAFTTTTGIAPMTFLTNERMERAAGLLRSEVISIQQVGQRVGYTIESSFARAFKRHWEVSPRVYQRGFARHPSPDD